MPNFCCVVGCSNRSNREKDRSFFNIPKIIAIQGEQTRSLSEERRLCWLSRINRRDWSPNNSRICSDHFINGRPSKLYDTAHPDWAPSVKMGYDLDIGLSKLNGQSLLPDEQGIDDDLDNHFPVSEDYSESDCNLNDEMMTPELPAISNPEKNEQEILPEDALSQEQACEKLWTDLFEKSSFKSFEEFVSIFTRYQEETFSAYRIFDCNRVETANFKRKSKLSSSLKYASVTFYCALFGQQKPRGKNLFIQNYRSQSCPSFIKLTSSSRDQQLRVFEKNLLHNHKLEKTLFDRFNQSKKLQPEITKDEFLDALSSVEVIIKDEPGCSASPPGNELSNGDKQNLCSDVTGGMGTTLIQMETVHFRKWMTILEDLLLKMELDANSETNFGTHKKSKPNSVQSKRRAEKLETCDTDKEVCNACKKHEPPKRVCPTRVIEWIDCDSCAKWYHRACLPSIMNAKNYKCTSCAPPI